MIDVEDYMKAEFDSVRCEINTLRKTMERETDAIRSEVRKSTDRDTAAIRRECQDVIQSVLREEFARQERPRLPKGREIATQGGLAAALTATILGALEVVRYFN